MDYAAGSAGGGPGTGCVEVLGGGVPYLDGAEDELLQVMTRATDRSSGSDELAQHIRDWPTRYHLSPLRENLLLPVRLGPGTEVLDIGCGTGALTRKIAESGAGTIGLEGSPARAQVAAARVRGLANARIMSGSLSDFMARRPSDAASSFDVIVLCGVLEYSGAGNGGAAGPETMLAQVRSLLKPGGCLVLAIENRWGLKYLLSYTEDHLGVPWMGIEGYWGDRSGVRTWSRRELREMLVAGGFAEQAWFAAYPDYKLPSVLVRDRLLEDPASARLVKQFVRTPTSDDAGPAVLNADPLASFHSALDAGLGMELANSFLVICGSPGSVSGRTSDAALFLGVPARAKAWRGARALVPDAAGWRLLSMQPAEPVQDGPLSRHRHDSPVVVGDNAEDLIAVELARAGARSPRLGAVLHEWWRAAQAVIPTGAGSVQLDVSPGNFIVDPAGQWHFVDSEWEWSAPIEHELVALRSIAWTADRICRRTGFIHGISSDQTVMQVTTALCEQAGIELRPGLAESFLAFESTLQSKVAGQGSTEARDSMREQLAAVFSARLGSYTRSGSFNALYRQREAANEELRAARSEVEALRRQVSELNAERDAVLQSRTWRWGQAIRHPLARLTARP